MIKLLIVGVGRNLHHTYNTIHPAILIFLCLCDVVHHYRATFTPVLRGDLHLGAGCSAVQAVLYTVQGTGVHTPLYAMVTIPSSCVMDCHGCSISSAQCQVKPTFVGVQLRLGRRYCLSHKYDTIYYLLVF